MTARSGAPPENGAGADHGGAGAGRVEHAGGGIVAPTVPVEHPRRRITADGITKLLSSRCVDCNGPTVGDVEAILDGFVLFLTRHAATCPMWGERSRDHGVGSDDVLLHPLGHLAGDEDVLVFLGDVGGSS